MKRLLAVLTLAALLGAPASLPADEVPYLDFIRDLRSRYPDLAEEYLKLLRQSNPPADVAAVIPLELAKVHLELANTEADANSRGALYNKARQEFQEFIDKNPTNLHIADARVDLARVTSLQGRSQLNKALLEKDDATRTKGALQARQTFALANAQLQAAADQLTHDIDKIGDPKTPEAKNAKHTLEQARLQADLDRGLNKLDEALTYVDKPDELKRGTTVEDAMKVLQKVATGDAKNSLTYQTRAWIGYCQYEVGVRDKALASLKDVIGLTEPAAAAGRRLAMFFQMKILKEIDPAQVLKDGKAWLAEYRSFAGTPEGCGVRYYLADALERKAQDTKDKNARNQLLAEARDLVHDLMNTENEYRDQARILSIQIIRLEGGFEKDIKALTNFDECITRAEYEVLKAKEFAEKKEPKPQPEDIAKERTLRNDNAIAALERALEFAGKPGTKVSKADETKARLNLCYFYFTTNRSKDAIRIGEDAARAVPPTSQSALAAMYVLEAYNNYINHCLNSKDPNERASLADLEGDGTLTRMKSLADMMITRWPKERAGDVGHHMRGLLFLKQGKTLDALDDLSKVSPEYPSLIYVKYQLSAAAFQAAQDRAAQAKAETDMTKKQQFAKDQAQFEKQAMEALRTLPELPRSTDSVTTSIWLNGKIDLARAHFRRHEYGEIDKVVDPLLKGLAAGAYNLNDLPPDPDDPKKTAADQTRTSLVLLKLYGQWGLADAEFTAGHAAKVKEIIDPVMNAIMEGKYPELKYDPRLRWGVMGMGLRVHVQEGNTDRALKILQAAQKFAESDEGDAAAKEGAAKGILMEVAKTVKDQLREVRKKKDEKALKEAVEKYTGFVGALEKGAKPKGTEEEFNRILAEAYSALGNHGKAVELARLVREPKKEDFKDEKVFNSKTSNYHFCRFLIVRELRLDGKPEEAAAELDEVKKTAWGKDHPEATKEMIHLVGEKGLGKAASEWNALAGKLGQKMAQGGTKETRDQFFECYYYGVEYTVRFAKGQKDDKKKEDYLKKAANNIVRLERGYPDLGGDDSKARFQDLLDREPELKDQYDKLKGDK